MRHLQVTVSCTAGVVQGWVEKVTQASTTRTQLSVAPFVADGEDGWRHSRPDLTVRTTAQRHPHIGNDGVLMYSDDDNDSFRDALSPPRTTPKKGADKRVRVTTPCGTQLAPP